MDTTELRTRGSTEAHRFQLCRLTAAAPPPLHFVCWAAAAAAAWHGPPRAPPACCPWRRRWRWRPPHFAAWPSAGSCPGFSSPASGCHRHCTAPASWRGPGASSSCRGGAGRGRGGVRGVNEGSVGGCPAERMLCKISGPSEWAIGRPGGAPQPQVTTIGFESAQGYLQDRRRPFPRHSRANAPGRAGQALGERCGRPGDGRHNNCLKRSRAHLWVLPQ